MSHDIELEIANSWAKLNLHDWEQEVCSAWKNKLKLQKKENIDWEQEISKKWLQLDTSKFDNAKKTSMDLTPNNKIKKKTYDLELNNKYIVKKTVNCEIFYFTDKP